MYEDRNENGNAPDEYIYKTVMDGKRKSRVWSVASLVLSILSLICCCFSWPSLVMGILGVVFAVVSRLNIGYFDGLALAGLIVGIFGIVFGAAGIIGTIALENSDFYKEFMKEFEEIYGSMPETDPGAGAAPGGPLA